MNVFLLILVGVAFIFFAALVFSVLTLILDKLGVADFQVWGSGTSQAGWFWEFYKRYLIIAAVYTVCCDRCSPCEHCLTVSDVLPPYRK